MKKKKFLILRGPHIGTRKYGEGWSAEGRGLLSNAFKKCRKRGLKVR